MRADGMTFRPRHISDPVVAEDLCDMERTEDGPHRDEVGVKTMTVLVTMQGAIRITSASCVDHSF